VSLTYTPGVREIRTPPGCKIRNTPLGVR